MTVARHAGASTVEEIEDALFDWVQAATGLADAKIIIGEQNGPRPDGDFITINVGEGRRRGTDLLMHIYNAEEDDPLIDVEQRAVGVREITVSVMGYTGSTNGSTSASARLARVRDALSLDSVRLPLNAVGLSVLDPGSVVRLNKVVNSDYEGQASLDVLMYSRSTISDFTGYIASATVEATLNEDETTFEVPEESPS